MNVNFNRRPGLPGPSIPRLLVIFFQSDRPIQYQETCSTLNEKKGDGRNMNLRIFCRSLCRRSRRCLSSPLLWSKHFAIIVTWRHTCPLCIFPVMLCTVDLEVWQRKTREPYCVNQKICWRIFGQRYPPWLQGNRSFLLSYILMSF